MRAVWTRKAVKLLYKLSDYCYGLGMNSFTYFLIWFVALEHIGFMVLEMFLWTKPIGLKIFRMKPEVAASSKTLAANQGLYNGFLAAGLIWSALEGNPSLSTFFLSCVVIAGVFGALTVSFRIFFVQGLPALLGLALNLR